MQNEIGQLVPATSRNIDGNGHILTISARDLHSYLAISKDFSDWIKRQIKRARLNKNKDFLVSYQEGENPKGGRPAAEYYLTMDAAKSIAMLSATPKGDEVRAYFIECERRYFSSQPSIPVVQNPVIQIAIETLVRLDAVEQKQIEQEKAIAIAQNNALEALAGQQWVTIRQYVTIHQMVRQLPPGTEQQQYGRWLTGYCREKGLPIYKQQSEQYREWSYPVWTIQQTLHAWLGRRHSQGPITDLRIDDDGVWYEQEQ